MTGINLLPCAAPIRSSVCQRTEFPKRTMISGRRIFSPLPLPLSFFRPRTYRKGHYFYSPQSSTVIKSISRTRTRFRSPKIRLHCRLAKVRSCELITSAETSFKKVRKASQYMIYHLRMNSVTGLIDSNEKTLF